MTFLIIKDIIVQTRKKSENIKIKLKEIQIKCFHDIENSCQLWDKNTERTGENLT